MKLIVFGLSVSSSWGNGHATLWRGLIRALSKAGHHVTFFEKDAPWYAAARDLRSPEFFDLRLYDAWSGITAEVEQQLRDADAAIVTSYCPDAFLAMDAIASSRVPAKVFYDLDTPVTLAKYYAREPVPWLPSNGYADFDLVLSYSGGRSLRVLERELGARLAVPLYGSADPDVHAARMGQPIEFALSYLGTYAADRQAALESLFIEPARLFPEKKFVLGGSQYPKEFPWTKNIFFRNHVEPSAHNSFYCASSLTLNITRQAMLEFGHCPSGRLFEAAACEVPVLTDTWDGLAEFFEPGREILPASNVSEAVEAISSDPDQLKRIGRAARERVLAEHTATKRAHEMVTAIERCSRPAECLPPALAGGCI